jgi:hypothetical protein
MMYLVANAILINDTEDNSSSISPTMVTVNGGVAKNL